MRGKTLAFKYHEYWELLGVDQHSQFEAKLKELLFKPREREEFYKRLLEVNYKVSEDTFKEYFELYSAERKTNQQDFTPESITKVITEIIAMNKPKESGYSAYDPAAGTGTLLIAQWDADRKQVSPFNYFPHEYFYVGEELSDTALIYLLHNMALRGMNAVIMHGNSIEREYKQVYFVQNSSNDYMKFSDINVMPRSKTLERALGIRSWTGEPIEHIESYDVPWFEEFKEAVRQGE